MGVYDVTLKVKEGGLLNSVIISENFFTLQKKNQF